MTPHSSTLAGKIPWTEEPGRLQSMGSLRVWHSWVTSPSLFTFMHWRRKWQPTPVFLPGESQGCGNLWAAVYGVAQSWTRWKWLSSSSSKHKRGGSVVFTKNPAMKEMQVRSLGQEDPLEKGISTPVLLPGEPYGQRSLGGYSSWGCQWVGHDLVTKQQQAKKSCRF